MSAAMDDFGISGVSIAPQSDYTVEQVKPETSEKENTEKSSGIDKAAPEINDVFVKTSSKEQISFEKLQNDYADIEQRKQMLDAIDAMLAQTDKTNLGSEEANIINSMLDEAVPQDNQNKASEEQAIQQQEAEEQKTVNEEGKAEKDEQTSDSAQEKEKAAREVSELRAKVSEKQQEIAKLQKELYHKVSSVVEIALKKNMGSEKPPEQQAEELKSSVSQNIKENPIKSIKMQLTEFDENLLLAMLTLHK
jgi:hypothetical protein